jgi:hypothetical protein
MCIADIKNFQQLAQSLQQIMVSELNVVLSFDGTLPPGDLVNVRTPAETFEIPVLVLLCGSLNFLQGLDHPVVVHFPSAVTADYCIADHLSVVHFPSAVTAVSHLTLID